LIWNDALQSLQYRQVYRLFPKPKPDKKYKSSPLWYLQKFLLNFEKYYTYLIYFNRYLVFEICSSSSILRYFFHKKQNWEKFKSKLTFTHFCLKILD
jgi:hypothetical protein